MSEEKEKVCTWSEKDLFRGGPVLQPLPCHLPHHAQVVLDPAVIVTCTGWGENIILEVEYGF